tara:strand:- start:9910 stop:10608 length:699 start_codon:yes stop_codon:yes gene_type:complete
MNNDEYLGESYNPGDSHYRAYVGPPIDYDLIAAMVFNLLTSVGLKQHHKLIDVGCGSLRLGRLLLPYLNKENYIGIEPNKWLVEDGIINEVGQSLIDVKKPQFIFDTDLKNINSTLQADFVVAQSIFSHCGNDLLLEWFIDLFENTNEESLSLVTFIEGENDCSQNGWIYPGCVSYTEDYIKKLASDVGFRYIKLNWFHPRQQWVALIKGCKTHYFEDNEGEVSWNLQNAKL